MPYNFSTETRDGHTVHCMMSKESGKKYCYKSAAARTRGMRAHEYFKDHPKKTGKKK